MKRQYESFKKYFLALFCFFSLSSCSFLSPVKVQQPTAYVINKVPFSVAHKRKHALTLLVAPPQVSALYDTRQMAYTIKPYQIAYFSHNEWAEKPAQMLEPLLVQTLQNTHAFRAVLTPLNAGHYDYLLNVEILQLEQDFTQRPAVLHLKSRVQLVNANANRVIATQSFSVNERLRTPTPYSGVRAANYATAIMLREIAAFTIHHLKR